MQICEQKSYKKNPLRVEIVVFFRHTSLLLKLQKIFYYNLQTVNNSITKLRVRYGETDQMGVVYYGNYAQYLEQGRTEWLRELGFSYRWMEANNIQLPVVHLSIDYKHPARYDDLLTIKTSITKLPTVKIEFYYEIYNESKQLLITATTVLVFIDTTTKKLMKAPDYLLNKLREEKSKRTIG